MAARRNKYKSDFKAQVALEALTGEKTTQELAQIYKIYPAMITAWKRQLIKGSASIFDKTHEKDDGNVDVELLYKKIGQLEVEKDFLAPLARGHSSPGQRRQMIDPLVRPPIVKQCELLNLSRST